MGKDKKINYERVIGVFNKYSINEELKTADIFHMYAKEQAFPNGYHDSMFFDLWIFNTDTMEKRFIPNRDGLSFNAGVQIYLSRIFIDGSTLIRLTNPRKVDIFQCVTVR